MNDSQFEKVVRENKALKELIKDKKLITVGEYNKLILAYTNYESIVEKFNEAYDLGSKETAEKILNELYCTPKEQVENKIKDLARFIGVEIKE